jgi:Raf kinase inhibitor-like YbhB/YbcL family protein
MLRLESPAFPHQGEIPSRYTSDGQDVSPPLRWSGAPAGTMSIALVVEDPDAPDPRAPMRTWVHWVVYNLPASVHELAEGASGRAMPKGAIEGRNDWKRTGYGGPSPPIGRHRYMHELYALDMVLPDLGPLDAAALRKAMAGHVLAHATLIGTYEKQPH